MYAPPGAPACCSWPALRGTISQNTASASRLRPASFEDYPSIARLTGRYNLKMKTAEEWRYLWEANPEFIRIGDKWPIGWVLEDRRQEIVGYFGNIPVAYEFQGKRLTAAAAHGWVVDTTHRGSTIQLVDRYFSQSTVDLFVSTTTNYPAGKRFEAMHGSRIPSPHNDVALFWVTDHLRFCSSLLQRKGIPAARLLKHALGGLVWGYGQAKAGINRVSRRSRLQGACIQPLTWFDERFDEFWLRLRRAGGMLRCVRDRQTLEWHFGQASAKGDAWIFVALQGSLISAYSVFVRQDNRAVGLKKVRLADFQSLDSDFMVLLPMISAALTRCRTEGVHVLESIGFGAGKRAILEAHAPFRRRLPVWMFFYKATDERLAQQLSRPEVWDACSYDGDASL